MSDLNVMSVTFDIDFKVAALGAVLIDLNTAHGFNGYERIMYTNHNKNFLTPEKARMLHPLAVDLEETLKIKFAHKLWITGFTPYIASYNLAGAGAKHDKDNAFARDNGVILSSTLFTAPNPDFLNHMFSTLGWDDKTPIFDAEAVFKGNTAELDRFNDIDATQKQFRGMAPTHFAWKCNPLPIKYIVKNEINGTPYLGLVGGSAMLFAPADEQIAYVKEMLAMIETIKRDSLLVEKWEKHTIPWNYNKSVPAYGHMTPPGFLRFFSGIFANRNYFSYLSRVHNITSVKEVMGVVDGKPIIKNKAISEILEEMDTIATYCNTILQYNSEVKDGKYTWKSTT